MLLGIIMVSVAILTFKFARYVSNKLKPLTSTEKGECLTSSGCLCGNCNKRNEPTI